MTTKGEAVAIGIAQMATSVMVSCDHGCVAKVSSFMVKQKKCLVATQPRAHARR